MGAQPAVEHTALVVSRIRAGHLQAQIDAGDGTRLAADHHGAGPVLPVEGQGGGPGHGVYGGDPHTGDPGEQVDPLHQAGGADLDGELNGWRVAGAVKPAGQAAQGAATAGAWGGREGGHGRSWAWDVEKGKQA